MQTTQPIVHVTNYNKHIDGEPLREYITNALTMLSDEEPPATVHVSVAYVDILKVPKSDNVHKTVLALSIRGKTYRYVLFHPGNVTYLAKRAIDLNEPHAAAFIPILQQAFLNVIALRIGKIVNDILKQYNEN